MYRMSLYIGFLQDTGCLSVGVNTQTMFFCWAETFYIVLFLGPPLKTDEESPVRGFMLGSVWRQRAWPALQLAIGETINNWRLFGWLEFDWHRYTLPTETSRCV